jgi:hypothetical protein
MTLLNWITSVGNHLGLIRVVEVEEPARPEKLTTHILTLSDLVTQFRGDEVRALAQLPAELSLPFDRIFQAAAIKPPIHGWDIHRLQSLLATDQYKSMDRSAAQQAILGLLATEKAHVDDLIKDALARDQAIDAFETFVRQKMTQRGDAQNNRIAEIDSQIRQLQEEIARLQEEIKTDQEHLRQWHQKKIAYEKDLAAAVSYLLDKPIVTIAQEQ